MADLSQLGNLKSSEPLDLPIYPTKGQSRPFPPEGDYTARTPEAFPPEAFGESRAGYLTADVSPTIVGGEYDGYKINFTKVSAKTWKNKKGETESQIGRYLNACHINGMVDGEPQAQADAVERTANTLVEIRAIWVARHRESNFELKGMKNFPLKDGKPSRFVTLDGKDGRPSVTDPLTQEPLVIRAYLEVDRFSEVSQ